MVRTEFLKKWEKYLNSERWNKWGAGGFKVWGHGAFPYVADLVPNEAKKVLELGCADGYLVKLLIDKGHDAVGLTFAKGEYDECLKRNLPVLLGDMHDLPFEDFTIDAVVSRQTLEHALCIVVVLRECDRVVKNGGYLIIHVPETLDGIDTNPEHICTLTPYQWKHWVEKHTSFIVIKEGFDKEQKAYWLVARK